MKIAVVTGTNRGIGREIVKQLAQAGVKVFASARTLESVRNVFPSGDTHIVPCQVNVADPESIRKWYEHIAQQESHVDILINNAGVFSNVHFTPFETADLKNAIQVNVFGVMECTRALWPLLVKSTDARIISISSLMGAMAEVTKSDHPAYRVSKYILNVWAQQLAAEVPANITVNNVCPGWCHTDMGGPSAPLTPAQGAETAVWLALRKETQNGTIWEDKKIADW